MAGEQKPSSNLLEQFILLAKGTSGSALTTLISQVLEAPGVYVFGELLELANVQEVTIVFRQSFCLLCAIFFSFSRSPANFNIGTLLIGIGGEEIKDNVLELFYSMFP